MRARIHVLICFALLLIAAAAQAQVPSQLQLVLDDMSRYLGRTVTIRDFSQWNYTVGRYTDSALGCPSVSSNSIPQGINGYTFIFTGNGITYDWRISEDGAIVFPCDAGILQQGTAAPPPTSLPATSLPPTVASAPCPPNYAGYLPPRLQVGAQARIEPGGTPNRIRQTPGITGVQIGVLNAGSVADVIGGPSCDSISLIIWWQVRFSNIVGWTAEGVLPDDYFVDPIGNQPTTPVPAGAPALPDERSVITPANVFDLAPVLTLPVAAVSDIAFTADQSLVAFGSFGGAFVYMLPTLFEEPMLTNPLQGVAAVAFSPDGRFFAYGTFTNVVTIADIQAAGRVTQLANPPTEGVNALAFSPDGSYRLAIASGALYGGTGTETVGLYDVVRNTKLIEFDADFWVNGVAFNDEGTQLAWMDTALHIFDVATGDEILNASVDALGIGPVTFTPDGSAVIYADGNNIVLLPLEGTGQPQIYEATAGLLPSTIAFNPNGTLLAVVSVPGEGSIEPPVITIFDVETGDVIFEQQSESSRTLAFSPDGTLLVVAESEEVIFLAVP